MLPISTLEASPRSLDTSPRSSDDRETRFDSKDVLLNLRPPASLIRIDCCDFELPLHDSLSFF